MVTGKQIRQGFLLLILLTGCALAGWHFWRNREDDETALRRILAEVTANITKREGDGTTSNLINSKALPKYFASPCEISLGSYIDQGYLDAEGITNHSMRIRTMFRTIAPAIKDLRIEIAPDGRTAVADFVATVSGILNNGERGDGMRDLRCTFVRTDDDQWKIKAVSIRDVLER